MKDFISLLSLQLSPVHADFLDRHLVLLLLSDLGWVRLVNSLLDFQRVVWVLLKKFLFFLLYSENIVVVDAVIVFLSGRLGLL